MARARSAASSPKARSEAGGPGASASSATRCAAGSAGAIPDVAEAVASPQRLSDDPELARRVLELVPQVPTPVWGRDELATGEMWNSNSLIAWLIVRSGLSVETVALPAGGRAPGWDAGLAVARRG